MTGKEQITILPATSEDIPDLVNHHKQMFEEILFSQGSDLNVLNTEKMDEEYTAKLSRELGKTCNAWVIKIEGSMIASGAVSILSMVPVPHDYSCRVAYIHSIFTEKEYRNKGYAKQIMEQAIQFCTSKGIKRLILNTSDAGKSVYEKLGFELANNSMRKFIKG